MTATPQRTPSQRSRALRRFATNPGALMGGFILVVLVIASLLAPAIAPYNWNATDAGPRLAPPSGAHFFGTDLHGRDIFSRILYGGRLSLSVGLATVLFSALFGSIFGVIIGYLGGRADAIGSRAIDVLLGFPPIVKAILIVAILGVGLTNVVIAAGIAGVPRFARVVRGAVLAVKEQPYFEAARALGARNRSIMWKHVVPNILPTIIVLASLDLGGAIISTASLSFIGLGAQPPTPEWGAMLNQGREYMRYAPWMMIFPGLMLFLAVMSVNLLGDRLSQALDPRMANQKG